MGLVTMKDGIDRRHDHRAPISLPFEIKTSQGTIRGKTSNISAGGLALLLFRETSNVGEEFQINLMVPDNSEADLACKKRWAGKMIVDETVYTAIGVQFT